MHSTKRLVLSLAVAMLAGALAVTFRPGTGTEVDISTAMQTFDGSRSAASRSAEEVRYDDVDLELVAVYVVDGGALVAPGDPIPADHRAAWEAVTQVLPAPALLEVRQLNVVTDGVNGTLGMVHRSGVAADHWILSIDLAEPADVLAETLVHEYAHMLTMRRDDLSVAGGACDGVALAIGCARTGSVLAQWSEAFWPDISEPATADSGRFVSEYAATAVHEDLAETFLTYVTGQPSRRTPELDAKLAFFAARPEFADAASAFRALVNAG